MDTIQNNSDSRGQAQECPQPLTQFYIYEGMNLVSDQVFDKDQITIGSSREADVLLDHQSVADIHALVHYRDNQVFLTNKFPQDGLRLNGRSVGLAELRHDDVIEIGPFSLKINLSPSIEAAPVEESVTYAVRLVNRYGSRQAMQAAAANLAKMLRTEPDRILPLMAKEQFILKKGLSGIKAAQMQNALIKAGVVCDVQVEAAKPPEMDFSEPLPAAPAMADRSSAQHVEQITQSVQESPPVNVSFTEIYEDEEDEDEEEIWEAPFELKARLDDALQPAQSSFRLPGQLQVVKTVGQAVTDVRLLQKRQKYYIETDNGRFCLVSSKFKGDHFVSLTPDFSGYIQSLSGQILADLESYKTSEYRHGRKTVYSIPMPEKDVMVIEAGGCSYRIASVQRNPSPHVAAVKRETDFSWRHWAASAGTHFFLLLCISVYMYLQAAPKMPEPHFVKIDTAMLQKLQAPMVQPKPKPEPKKTVTKAKPLKKKTVKKKTPPRSVAKKRRSKSKRKTAAQASRHPNAGGGFGKGNIKNRNINQAGILSVLGNSSLGGPSQAIASVTNLDAVAVPGATDKNFSVGGLKGSLGNGKIAVATGGAIMQTKGGKQVLRSAGARGKGTVAALERGTTGRKQVQGMVSAKLSRTVKIKGGMSREMVKRVIDQHLEEITYCYETALMTNPNILGRIVFEWKILMNGRVGEIRIAASSINSHEIHNCIKSAIKSWQFPKPVGTEVVVSYPFVFDLVTF